MLKSQLGYARKHDFYSIFCAFVQKKVLLSNKLRDVAASGILHRPKGPKGEEMNCRMKSSWADREKQHRGGGEGRGEGEMVKEGERGWVKEHQLFPKGGGREKRKGCVNGINYAVDS